MIVRQQNKIHFTNVCGCICDEMELERAILCKAQKADILARNDGLTLEDWREWFRGYDLSKPMAVIHFTKFRY